MHEAKINNTIIHIPSRWDELNRHYLQIIAGLSSLNLSETQFKTHLLFHGAGILVRQEDARRNPSDRSEKLYLVKLSDGSSAHLSADQVTSLCNLFDFLFRRSEDGEKVSLDSKLTKNLVPHFRVSGVMYYGPSEKLFNVTLSEFIHAETNLGRYLESKNIEELDKLIAILYRPEDHHYDPESPEFGGDRRMPFNDHRFGERARKIHKLNHSVKICILFYYQGCQWWYQQQFPHVFGHNGKKSENNLGFLNLVDSLTNNDITKVNEVHKSLLMDVMVHLERAAADYEEMEQKMKRNDH